ncbi:hypothetical protein [Halorussus salinisoli]|uniref:hypothetical protein n=1 Tax=Halorussus salinisoli TaxID=2558242 RepID=UPI0010C204C0|nr:hypothetical protein [Halorussus salinisoli]
METKFESSDIKHLSRKEQNALNSFLKQRQQKSFTIPKRIVAMLQEWHGESLTRKHAKTTLLEADTPEHYIRSIDRMAKYPLTIDRTDTNRGSPRFYISHRGRDLRCTDIRETDEEESDFIITFMGESESPQAIALKEGNLDFWRVYGVSSEGKMTPGSDFVEHLSPLIDLLTCLTDYDLALDRWDFENASERELPTALLRVLDVEKEHAIQSVGRSGATSNRLSGVVETLSNIGYGILTHDRVADGVVFSDAELSFTPEVGDEVTFILRRENGRLRATDIRQSKGSGRDVHKFDSSVFPSDVESTISNWSQTPESVLNRLTRIASKATKQVVIQSIRLFSEFEDEIRKFTATSDGTLCYTIGLPEKRGYWVCEHHILGASSDFTVTIHPRDIPDQIVRINEGRIENWTISSDITELDSHDVHTYILSRPDFVKSIVEFFASIGWYEFEENPNRDIRWTQST